MSDFFRKLITEINDDDTSIAADGLGAAEYSGCVDTGCYALNAVLSGSLFGGAPNNKITAFAGESSTGKTFFVMGIVRHFLENNPTAGVVYYDTEAAVTKAMMEDRDIDTNRVILSEPDTIQRFRHHALKLIDAYIATSESKRPPMLFVLDSLGMLSTTKELEDTTEGKETKDMTKAQVIKATFRVLTLKLAKAKIPFILTNHVYAEVGSMFPTNQMSGGSGVKYAASTIAMLSKAKDKDGAEVVGNIITVKVVKSRLSRENGTVKLRLSYDRGLDKYYGLLDMAEASGLFKKVSTRYELPDGKKVFGKEINDHPEKYFTDEVLQKLEVYANKVFRYGSDEDDTIEFLETEEADAN